jgi:hypothetical protein
VSSVCIARTREHMIDFRSGVALGSSWAWPWIVFIASVMAAATSFLKSDIGGFQKATPLGSCFLVWVHRQDDGPVVLVQGLLGSHCMGIDGSFDTVREHFRRILNSNCQVLATGPKFQSNRVLSSSLFPRLRPPVRGFLPDLYVLDSRVAQMTFGMVRINIRSHNLREQIISADHRMQERGFLTQIW